MISKDDMRDDPEMDHEAFMAEREARRAPKHHDFHRRQRPQGNTDAHKGNSQMRWLQDWNSDPVS